MDPPLALVAALAVGFLLACDAEERPPRARLDREPEGDAGWVFEDSGSGGPPAADAAGYCGNQVMRTRERSPNLYFVIDRSASMDETLPGSAYDKFTSTRVAVVDLIRAIGHRVSYGAAAFPAKGGGCAEGGEVFPTRPGDPVSFAAAGQDGPVLKQLTSVLAALSPEGGTPTALTMAAITPNLLALEGDTTVILATDGQPNCNPHASCGLDGCYLTLMARQGDVSTIGGVVCDETVNCCDPQVLAQGQLQCVDTDATVSAVETLTGAGIHTYVIGMPGSEYFASELDRVALAGGTGREAPPHYYPVENADELGATLRKIGASVSLSCDVELTAAPPDPDLVNVYFDLTLLPYDEQDGWAWTGQATLQIRGTACDSLMGGDILQVQVVSGCPTEVR